MNLRLIFTFIFLSVSNLIIAQVGINTDNPQGALDIVSTNSGVVLPRIALSSSIDGVTVVNPAGGPVAEGTIVYNTGTGGLSPAGYFIWDGAEWDKVVTANQKQVHFGYITITSSGSLNVTGVGFTPSSIEFTAINRVQNPNDGFYRSGTNNSNDVRMAGGISTGFAQSNSGGRPVQFAMSTGISGSSINNLGTYSSTSHCIAAVFTNNNGEPIHDNGSASNGGDSQGGLIRASLTSFDTDGFTLNVDRFLAGSNTNSRTNQIVVMYKAYR